MAGSMDLDTPTQEIDRLRRELHHVNEQCQVAHAMAMNWRERGLAAEERCRRLERKLRNLKRRKGLEHLADVGDEDSPDEALSIERYLNVGSGEDV